MSDLFKISDENREFNPFGWMTIEPPFDTTVFENVVFIGNIQPFTDNHILDDKEKIITRQSPNRDITILDNSNSIVAEMIRDAAFSSVYEAIKTNVDTPLILLFIYRRQFWDWEIVCHIYADKVSE